MFERDKKEIFSEELPYALRSLALFLELGIPFVIAMNHLAADDGIGRLFKKAKLEIEKGASAKKVLGNLAMELDNSSKRAISQLIIAYDIGQGAGEIRKIADDLLSIRQHEMKQCAAKNSIYGLIFVVLAAVLPMFFMIITASGSVFGGEEISGQHVEFAMLFLFPAIGAVIVLAATSLSLRGRKNNGMILVIGILAIGAASFFAKGTGSIITIALITAILAAVFYRTYLEEKRIENLEREMPNALLAVSSLPRGSNVKTIFEIMSGKEYGEFGKESRAVLSQLQSNVSVEKALDDLQNRNSSKMLQRTVLMMKHAISTARLDKISSIAEDIMKISEIERERETLLSMQKYTVILGAVIVPVILKTALSTIKAMSGIIDSSSDIAVFADAAPAYLASYALLGSYYVSEIEGKRSGQMIYFIAMAISALVILLI